MRDDLLEIAAITIRCAIAVVIYWLPLILVLSCIGLVLGDLVFWVAAL